MKIFTNATFISCEDENRVFSSMAVDKGKIVWCGDNIPTCYANVKTVDMNSACIVPVFADSHIHFESFALFNGTLDVRDAIDFKDMGRMFKEYENKHPHDKFIPAFGCCAHTVSEHRLPTCKDIDLMTNVPTIIVKYDGHAGVANSALIKMLPDEVKNDKGFDKETGWMYQNAFYLGVNFVTQNVPVTKVLKNIFKAADFMAKKGIGLIHNVEGVGYDKDIDVDLMINLSKILPQQYRLYFQTMDVDKVLKRHLPRIGGCFRLALDGCFGSEDAALLEPYSNNPENFGFLTHTQQQVNDFCIRANRENLQISMHAIGDAAVEQALTAYEAAYADKPWTDARHIIIHANLMDESMQQRAAKLGLCIATQPAFLYWRHEPQQYLDSILGEERSYAVMPLKSWIEKGIKVSGGSDSPCTIPNPIESIYYSCNHPNPKESVSVIDALRMHTSWAAYTSFDEKDRGTLTEGKIADFTVLDKNPLKTNVKELNNIKVTDIYFKGKKYRGMKKNNV